MPLQSSSLVPTNHLLFLCLISRPYFHLCWLNVSFYHLFPVFHSHITLIGAALCRLTGLLQSPFSYVLMFCYMLKSTGKTVGQRVVQWRKVKEYKKAKNQVYNDWRAGIIKSRWKQHKKPLYFKCVCLKRNTSPFLIALLKECNVLWYMCKKKGITLV